LTVSVFASSKKLQTKPQQNELLSLCGHSSISFPN